MNKRILVILFFWTFLQLAHLAAESNQLELSAAIGGTRIFLDEPFHFTIGGSVRFYLTDRIAIEPQILFSRSQDFREVSLLGNITFGFRPANHAIVPYLVVGTGIVNQLDKRIDFSSTDLTLNGGIGLRAYVHDRIFISPEARLGFHAFPQITMSIGYRLPF